ncbi:SufD family Fe-S cluster assembly protein [Pyrofollis japonicus]|uniref:SufD family Fe-S cluster assembly protein n=1 Tax=Pyrofollis japonicus TaxID=3060460 RepID=UPI00295A5B89|nr:SufD family Fe-S cluster assembly protein [Pyrofollis japonicus]BEP16695.1 SufD family Fe-S cluster assembly protein [Pyrofollis japonicus]
MQTSTQIPRHDYLEELVDKLPWQHIADSPTTRHYTDWSVFEKVLRGEYSTASENYSLILQGYDALIGCNGVQSSEPKEGIAVYRLNEAAGEHRRLFGRLVAMDENKLTAAHYARLEEPYIVAVKEPGVYRVGVCGRPGSGWSSTHLVIHVPARTKASLLVEIAGPYHGSVVMETFIEESSSLELLSVARPTKSSVLAIISRRSIAPRARLVSASLYRASAMHRIEEETLLQQHAEYVHRGIAVGRNNERIDYIANTFHDGRESRSNVELFGYALDESFVSARGVSTIREQAEDSAAHFDAEVLILGERAKAYTMPLMEINTGQVEAASHHAAQYRVPRDVVFYMQTRGLSPGEAIRLMFNERTLSAIESLAEIGKTISNTDKEKLVESLLALS